MKIKDRTWDTEDWHSHLWKKRPCGKQWWKHKMVLTPPRESQDTCTISLTPVNMYIHTSSGYTQNKKEQSNKTWNKSEFCLAIPRQDRNTSVTNEGVTWTTATKKGDNRKARATSGWVPGRDLSEGGDWRALDAGRMERIPAVLQTENYSWLEISLI